MISHIVLLKCRADITEQQLGEMFCALHNLVEKIPGLQSCTSGSNCSPEGINRGYSHAFYMQFCSEHSRDAYLTHPQHEQVKRLIADVLRDTEDNVLVMDF